MLPSVISSAESTLRVREAVKKASKYPDGHAGLVNLTVTFLNWPAPLHSPSGGVKLRMLPEMHGGLCELCQEIPAFPVVESRTSACYAARRSPLRGKAGLASQGNYGPDQEVDDSLSGPTAGAADQLDRTTRAESPRQHPNGTRRVTGSKAICGYVPEEPAAQCEGTCACNCNNLLSAVVNVYGHQRHFERIFLLSLLRCDSI